MNVTTPKRAAAMADMKEKLRRDVATVIEYARDNMNGMYIEDYVAMRQVCAALSDVLNTTATPPADAALADAYHAKGFEEWYSTYDPAHRGRKQQMRDAYGAALRAREVPTVPDVTTEDAPSWYNSDMAIAWAVGYEAAQGAMLAASREGVSHGK